MKAEVYMIVETGDLFLIEDNVIGERLVLGEEIASGSFAVFSELYAEMYKVMEKWTTLYICKL